MKWFEKRGILLTMIHGMSQVIPVKITLGGIADNVRIAIAFVLQAMIRKIQ
jgi:hypothetical protein